MSLKNSSVAVLILVLLTLLGVLSAKAAKAKTYQRTEKEFSYYEKKNTSELSVTYKGKIVLTDNDKGIASISPNGYLKIEQSSFGNKRTIEIDADGNGRLTKKYTEGKNETSFEKNGKEWLETLLPDLIYKTGIGGQERILRIYKQNGMNTALREAEKMKDEGGSTQTTIVMGFVTTKISRSSKTAYLYYKALLDNVTMNNNELEAFIEALEEVRSNSNKGSMLRIIINKYKLTPGLMEQLLETTASLDYNTERGNTLRLFQSKFDIDNSNYREYFRVIDGMTINSEKGNVLKPLLKNQKLSDEVFIALLESLQNFTNNSEKAAVLRLAATMLPDNKDVTDAFMATLNTLSSPYRLLKEELKNMLLDKDYLTRNSDVSESLMLSTLESLKNERANTSKSTTLRKLHASMSNDPKLIEAYFKVVQSMDNNMEAYNVILELMELVDLNKLGYIGVFDVAEYLARDDYKHAASAIIRSAITKMPNDKIAIDQLFDALEEIDHNSGREEIIRILTENKNLLKNGAVMEMIKIAEGIDMDIEKAITLQHIARVIPKNDEELNYLYQRVADEIESSYEYRRAITKN